MPCGSHLGHAGVVDSDRVVEGLLGDLDAVGLLAQSRVGGQGDEAGGVEGRAERAEDPLHDQEAVQVGLAQGALGQALEAVGDDVGEQPCSAASGAHALHGSPLPLQLFCSGGERALQPDQDDFDVVVALGTGEGRAGEGVADVVQGDPGVGHLADPQQTDHVLVAVAAAVVAASLGFGQQADLVVVTDRPGCCADERCRVADPDLTRRGEGYGHERGLPRRSGT
ncbi:hypothetical protein GCM10009756_24320 [Pseudokineococcus marinus]